MELGILDFIQTHFRTVPGDYIMIFLTRLGDVGWMWIVLAVILLCMKKSRKTGLMIAAALLVEAVLCNVFLKPLVARTRPYELNPLIELLIAKPIDYSFPSGHTAAAFATVTALFLAERKRLGVLFGILAAGIAFSRLYLYVHFPTDVLGGLILGILSGVLAKWICETVLARWDRKRGKP